MHLISAIFVNLNILQGVESNLPETVVMASEAGWSSGGGFSTYYPVPDFQKKHVEAYFSKVNNTIYAPVAGYGNGRGFPDITLTGRFIVISSGDEYRLSGGTSASSPLIAGFFSNINAARMAIGKGSLGWVNPALYATSASFTNDITEGSINCASKDFCCAQGFHAGPGWDPASGLGSVNYGKMEAVLKSLGNTVNGMLYAPTSDPTPSPSSEPTAIPTDTPTQKPSNSPSYKPSKTPTFIPSKTPTFSPSSKPTAIPTNTPTQKPTNLPTCKPSVTPTASPTKTPTSTPSFKPTIVPTAIPTTPPPTASPSIAPSMPTHRPTTAPPTTKPSPKPTADPTALPSVHPTFITPTDIPSIPPTSAPIGTPSMSPSVTPIGTPSMTPSMTPSAKSPSLFISKTYQPTTLTSSSLISSLSPASSLIPTNAQPPGLLSIIKIWEVCIFSTSINLVIFL